MEVWLLAQSGGRAYSGLILLVEGVLVVGGLLLFWAVYRRFLQEKIRWENAAAFQRPPEKLARSLESWDVVSFDLFDTLLRRPVEKPTEIFRLVGEKLGDSRFASRRIQAEQRARQGRPSGEVTLEEIYLAMGSFPGKETAKSLELELESSLCFADSYMLRLWEELHKAGKPLIVLSDMYLPASFLERLLEKAGYSAPTRLFVSCEYRQSKHRGGLFQIARQELEKEKRILHIGDNYGSDVQQARRMGWQALWYPGPENSRVLESHTNP